MCVTWLHNYACNHYTNHFHRCYERLLQRPCRIRYTCEPLKTPVLCLRCMDIQEKAIKTLAKSSSNSVATIIGMFTDDMEEHKRLEKVVEDWRKRVAGVVMLEDDYRGSGCKAARAGYVWTSEWRDGWLRVVRDEIGNRRYPASTDSTLTDSTSSDSILTESGLELALSSTKDTSLTSTLRVQESWRKLSDVEKLGAVKSWLEEETDEYTAQIV